MATFTAWKFETVDGAHQAADVLKQLSREGLVRIEDRAVLSWPEGAEKPDLADSNNDEWRAAGTGALWGLIVGALLLLPLVGAAAGAAVSLLHKHLEGVGLTKDQLERVGREVVPGTSALFVVTTSGDLDRVAERFHGQAAELIATNLVDDELARLREAFD